MTFRIFSPREEACGTAVPAVETQAGRLCHSLVATEGRALRLVPLCLAALGLAGGCAKVDPHHDYAQTAEYIEDATGQGSVFDPQNDEITAQQVHDLLQGGLTVDEAVRVCLLNNPSLRALFMEVGMARADVVQSGLFTNPSLNLAMQLPAGGGLANVQGGFASNIADLWQIPIRKKIAARALDRTILEIARQASDLAFDARAAYYATVGARKRHDIARENLEIAKELLDLSVARQKAGAGNAIDVNLANSQVAQAELLRESSRLAAANAARQLATLLGMSTDADLLVLTDSLPAMPSSEPNPQALVRLAMRWRLDLRAAEQAVAAAEANLQQQYIRIFPNLQLGVSFERAERQRQGGRHVFGDAARSSIANGALTAPTIQPRSERQRNKRRGVITGPSMSMVLPLFDQNQAQIAKARYAYDQAVKTLEALKLSATQGIRSAADQATTSWRIVRLYETRFIPLAKDNLDLSRKSYTAGRASFLSVLEAQRFFLDSRRRAIEASQAAANTIPALERSVGRPFEELLRAIDSASPTGDDTDAAGKGEGP